jgi:uncharacterized protein (TIGR02611 family)
VSDPSTDDGIEADAAAAQKRVGALGRLRERAKARRWTAITWRVGVTVAGVLIIVAGIAMLVVPGPGWGAIILGFVLLATEYVWAQRVLHPVKRGVSKAIEFGRLPLVRRITWVLVALATSALIGFGIWYVYRYGLSWDGMRQIWGSIRSTVSGWFGG